MRTVGIVLILGVCSVASAADLQPFVLTCSKLVVGPAETVKSAVRIDWDGSLLTSTEQNVDDQLEKSVETVIASRLLAPDTSNDVRISFLTSMNAEKAYRYYTSFHFVRDGATGSLVRMFSTTDKDGFLIEAGSIEYDECQLKFSSRGAT